MAPMTGPRVNWKGKLKALSSTVSHRPGYREERRRARHAPNDQHDTQWILADPGAHELERQFDIIGLLILDPFVQVPRHKHAVVLEPSALGEHRLEGGFVQIQTARLGDPVFVVLETAAVSFPFLQGQASTYAQ